MEDCRGAALGVEHSNRPNLTPSEASDYLRAKFGIRRGVKTLAKLRCISSDGPVFVRAGRNIVYPQNGLDDYGRQVVSAPMRSTSDAMVSRPDASLAA